MKILHIKLWKLQACPLKWMHLIKILTIKLWKLRKYVNYVFLFIYRKYLTYKVEKWLIVRFKFNIFLIRKMVNHYF